jgi:hypothetical protein
MMIRCNRFIRGLAIGAGSLVAAASASAGAQFFDVFGATRPSTEGLTSVYVFVRFTELGGPGQSVGSWQSVDAPAGVETDIDLPNRINLFEIDPATDRVGLVAVYEGGGVAVLLRESDYTPGVTEWSDLFAESEATVQGWLENGQTGALQSWFNNEVFIPGYAMNPGERGDIVNFSTATANGKGVVDYAVPAPPCPGDVDGDGDTDVFDFSVLASNFGAGPGATQAQGDLTGDGVVDVFDFSELVSDFGCEP